MVCKIVVIRSEYYIYLYVCMYVAALFPYEMIHLGGDEVSYTCWELSAEIKAWQRSQGLQGSEDTYEYFVDKVAAIARGQNRLPVQWVEVFEHFGNKLSNDTVVHIWKEKTTMDAVLQSGMLVLYVLRMYVSIFSLLSAYLIMNVCTVCTSYILLHRDVIYILIPTYT